MRLCGAPLTILGLAPNGRMHSQFTRIKCTGLSVWLFCYQSTSGTHPNTKNHSTDIACYCRCCGFVMQAWKAHRKREFFGRLLAGNRRRDSEAQTAFCTTACENLTAIGCWHSFTESVFVNSLSVRRLERSFHCAMMLFCLLSQFRVQN